MSAQRTKNSAITSCGTVLIVDDEPKALQVLSSILAAAQKFKMIIMFPLGLSTGRTYMRRQAKTIAQFYPALKTNSANGSAGS